MCGANCSQDTLVTDNTFTTMHHGNGSLSLTEINADLSSTNSQFLLFGGHDCCLNNVTSSQMNYNWRIKLGSAVSCTPFIGNIHTSQGLLPIVCCCAINGDVCIADLVTGKIIGRTQLPGEIFSSPVIVGDRIVVGCRDDNVYCIEISII